MKVALQRMIKVALKAGTRILRKDKEPQSGRSTEGMNSVYGFGTAGCDWIEWATMS